MNFATGEITEVKGFSDGKNINPQWSHDGKDIFFISDHNGIDNIYRKNIAGGKFIK